MNMGSEVNEATGAAKPAGMMLGWRLLFSVFFFGPAIYFALDGDYVTAAVCGTAGMGAFGGYRAGAFCIFTSLAAIAAAIAFAPSIGHAQELRFAEWFGTTGLTNRFLSVGVVGLIISLIVASLMIVIAARILKHAARLQTFNRWIGFGVGGLQGVVAVVFFLGGLLIVEPIEQERAGLRDPNDLRGRLVSKFILSTTQKTRESRLGTTIIAYNPFTRIPQLNKVTEIQQSVQVLSDPEQIQGILQHPSIKRLQQRPEVRHAVEKLTNDPAIQQILHSGKRMDRAMAMSLLSHPAVMELVDQPGFLEEASQIIRNTHLIVRN